MNIEKEAFEGGGLAAEIESALRWRDGDVKMDGWMLLESRKVVPTSIGAIGL